MVKPSWAYAGLYAACIGPTETALSVDEHEVCLTRIVVVVGVGVCVCKHDELAFR